jgi:pimeloyl-ACP methyl ester carboxylesterase
VLLLHAGGERRGVWLPVSERLAVSGFHAVAFDQRGHGDSGGNASTLSVLVDDACAVVDTLGQPVVLVGCSLGGFVSLLTSARPGWSGRVAGIVLVDVVPDPDPERVHIYLRRLESRIGPLNWALVHDILRHASALRDAAAGMHVPLALVRGEHGSVSDEDCARLRGLVPSVVIRVVEGAGHLVARDRADRLADVVLDLLHSLPWTQWRDPR